MTRGILYAIIMCVMTEGYINAESFYHVYLEPDKAERQVISIDTGPLTAQLILHPEIGSGWQIGNSSIVAPNDDWLWSGPYGYVAGTSPYPSWHMYLMLNGYSSREYVKIQGNLVKPGSGPGSSPWFRVTVPAADIDWDGYVGKEDEVEEDNRIVNCPVESDISKCKKFIVRVPRDDRDLVATTVSLQYDATAISVLQANGITVQQSGASIPMMNTESECEYYVKPLPTSTASWFEITLRGPTGPNGDAPEDKIRGTSVKVNLEKCVEGWDPRGGNEDNTTTIRVYVTPNTVKGTFKFTLFDVSDEKGFCLNDPILLPLTGEDSDSWKDLQFVAPQSGFVVSGVNNDIAQTAANTINESTVTIKSYDYGAYGKIKVEFWASLDSSNVIVGEEEGGSTFEFTRLPYDRDENHIRDGALQNPETGLDKAYDDIEYQPVGKGVLGDNLTRYEEYRGFMCVDGHVRTGTSKKTVFIVNATGELWSTVVFGVSQPGYDLYN